MRLMHVDLKDCKELHDLTPLAGMSLSTLSLPPDVTKGIDGIRNMKTLGTIDGMRAADFWKKWDAERAKAK
jgi:hypothetical protein